MDKKSGSRITFGLITSIFLAFCLISSPAMAVSYWTGPHGGSYVNVYDSGNYGYRHHCKTHCWKNKWGHTKCDRSCWRPHHVNGHCKTHCWKNKWGHTKCDRKCWKSGYHW